MELALRNFRLEAFAWRLSFLGTFAWELSLGKFRLGTLALDHWPDIFRSGTFAGELSPASLDFKCSSQGLDFRFRCQGLDLRLGWQDWASALGVGF